MDWGSKITYLAETRVKGQWVRFGIKDADRTSHISLVGKTGSGRGVFLTNMALQDIERGIGTIVLDGTGTFVQTLLERVPASNRDRLIVLDPSDGEHPFSWNPLDDFRALPQGEALQTLSETLTEMYQCPQCTLIEFVAAYMLSHKEATLLNLYELTADAKVRERLLPQKTEGRVRFESLLAESPDAVKAITENGRYLAKDVLMRNMLGQTASKFTLGQLKKGGVVIVDFSRIRMFPTRIAPLVRLFFLVARAYGAASAPSSIYMHDSLRYLSGHTLEKALLDRNIALAVSDTTRGEEPTDMREKLLQRAGSIFSFAPHERDVPLVERVFYPYVASDEFEKLEDGQLVVALSIDSVRSRPFFARALPPASRSGVSPLDIALTSRNTYTISRLAADKLFKPKLKDDEKKAEDPGSFSDAFRSIFTKRAGGDAGAPAGQVSATSATAAGAAPKIPPAKPTSAPDKKSVSGIKNDAKVTKEIPEPELKKMLHVKAAKHVKPKSS